MVAPLYELPSKDNNPFWPMPADYGERVSRDHRGKCCLRCQGRCPPNHDFCEGCRAKRKEMRLALMHGWHDPARPNILMRSPELFLAGLRFFVDFYVKGAEVCRHQYPLPDCRHKVTMQEMFCRPRSALVAPRYSSKTFSVVYEPVQFIAITRPNTAILLGSETKQLTKEKIKEIRRRTENNARIWHDFGPAWQVERSSSREWSNACLDFLNGSQLMGSSMDQATRGRHPLVGLIDDPEGKRSKTARWKKEFMVWLFQDYLNQFDDKGTHVMWIGTILAIDSCLYRAIHDDDEEHRFRAWERKILPMVYEENGRMLSCWPEKMTVAEFERKKRGAEDEDGTVTPIGMAAVMAEFQGRPVPRGQRMFIRDERRNGYILHGDADGQRTIYDPANGRHHKLDDMLQECYKHVALDCANSGKKRSDECAVVVGLYDADGVLWFIDAWARRAFYDVGLREALRKGHEWRAGVLIFEVAMLDSIAYRQAFEARTARIASGFHVPRFVSQSNDGVAKPLRIERMQPAFESGKIKLPVFHEMDGVAPAEHPGKVALQRLIDQFDTQTIEDDDHRCDDLLDAAEKIHRFSARRPARAEKKSVGQFRLEQWEKAGIEVDPMMAPEQSWTPAMRRKFQERLAPKVRPLGRCDAFV